MDEMSEVRNRLKALEEHKLQAHAFEEANQIWADDLHSGNRNGSSLSATAPLRGRNELE